MAVYVLNAEMNVLIVEWKVGTFTQSGYGWREF